VADPALENLPRHEMYIDRDGRPLLLPVIRCLPAFSEDLQAKSLDDRVWFVDKAGRTAFEVPEGKYAQDFSEGLAAVATEKRPGSLGESWDYCRWGFVDKTGVFVVPPSFDRVLSFSEGLARVISGGKAGFIDKTGAMILPGPFKKALAFKEGLAAVCNQETESWGFIDKTGKFVIAAQYLKATSFSQGRAAVQIASSGKWGYIDTSGVLVIPALYCEAQPFSEEFAAVRMEVGPRRLWWTQKRWGYIDTSGAFRIKPRFERAQAFSGGMAIVLPAGT
jgi:hypothetical protein